MFSKDAICISVANGFYQDKLQLLIDALDKGQMVVPIVDCIGHTRNNSTQEAYKSELIKRYGSRLIVECSSGVCSYNYTYKLNEE